MFRPCKQLGTPLEVVWERFGGCWQPKTRFWKNRQIWGNLVWNTRNTHMLICLWNSRVQPDFRHKFSKCLKPFKSRFFILANSLEHHWKLFASASVGGDTPKPVFEKIVKIGVNLVWNTRNTHMPLKFKGIARFQIKIFKMLETLQKFMFHPCKEFRTSLVVVWERFGECWHPKSRFWKNRQNWGKLGLKHKEHYSCLWNSGV